MYISNPDKPGDRYSFRYKTGRRVPLTNLLSPVVSRVNSVFGFMLIPDKTKAASLEQITWAPHATPAAI